jgi:hypothetical protein
MWENHHARSYGSHYWERKRVAARGKDRTQTSEAQPSEKKEW